MSTSLSAKDHSLHQLLETPNDFLQQLLHRAITAANPKSCLSDYLPADTSRPAIVIGAGKAAASMAAALETHWQGPLSGKVVTRYQHSEPCQFIEVHEAAHPVPDGQGEQLAKTLIASVSDLSENDLVICLLSGGGSSLLGLPAGALSLSDKQTVNKRLLASGASIADINTVRKHLSAIKGGRLAKACYPATLITYAISDVPGDNPEIIASGPTVPDSTTAQDALDILARYAIDIPPAVQQHLQADVCPSVTAEHPCFQKSEYHIISKPVDALQAAADYCRGQGIQPLVLGDQIEGEAKDIAIMHGAIARSIKDHGEPLKPPCVILSGGETSVTVKGRGRGGRNAEFLLALACYLKGEAGIYALAADTDGIDGTEDNAGATLSPQAWLKGLDLALDADAMLANNDGYNYFKALQNLIITGPTRTNVNDFRAILIK